MAQVRRANVVLTVKDSEINNYLDMGYDVIDEYGRVEKAAIPTDLATLRKAYQDQSASIARLEAENERLRKLVNLAQQKAAIIGASTGMAGNAAITSQSNDGVSVSYNVVSAGAVFDSYKQDVYTIIKQSLSYATNALGQKLLYMGVYPDE